MMEKSMASSELDQSQGESSGVRVVGAGTASGGGAVPRGIHTQMSIGQASGSAGGQPKHSDGVSVVDTDPTETQEWLDFSSVCTGKPWCRQSDLSASCH